MEESLPDMEYLLNVLSNSFHLPRLLLLKDEIVSGAMSFLLFHERGIAKIL